MDVVLITIALVSLAAAAGFGIVAWRTLDEQRRRSAARVAALAATLEPTPPAMGAGLLVAPTPHGGEGGRRLVDHPAPVAVSSMFATRPGAAVHGRPLIKAAVVAAMAIALVVIVAMANDGPAEQEQAAPARAASPLELVSMRHTREGDTLSVTGLVRNPRSGIQVARIAAVVFAFDRDGSFVTSAQAPLDFTTLEPGDESPFVVKLPNVADVRRYRVSFRTDSGVVRHIDRRAQNQLAMQ